jgi:hypothetical protein
MTMAGNSALTDRGPLPRVAWLVLIFVGCVPVKVPAGPGAEPGGVSRTLVKPSSVPSGRQILLGEMCPQGAGGRPAVAPLILRTVGWTDNPADITSPVERGSTPQWEVFGVDGKLAGAFDTMGVVDVGLPQQVAMGAYAGASPCTGGAQVNARPTGDVVTRVEDPKCGVATQSCGIAVAEITHPDEPPTTPAYVTGGACVSGDQLAVDIDGDGRIESFPLSGLLDGSRAPAAEWSASPTATATCTPAFELYDVKLKGEDPKSDVSFDVLGVVDLDGDGRRELVLAFKFATVRTIVVYTATSQPQRLELAGEATSFPR